jgi:hypothetical protein
MAFLWMTEPAIAWVQENYGGPDRLEERRAICNAAHERACARGSEFIDLEDFVPDSFNPNSTT